MPISQAFKAQLVQTGATALGQVYNAYQQNQLNQKQQQFSIDQYNRQRADALSDWNMNNEYNSPSMTMERLRKAGLNPNLVYGNGATTQAATVRSAESKTWSPTAPQIDPGAAIGSGLATYYDVQTKQAQIDNLHQLNTNMQTENRLKEAKIFETLTSNQKKQFDLGLATELRQTSADAARASLDKILQDIKKSQADTQFTLNQDIRAENMNRASLREIAARISQMAIQNAQTEAQKKNIEQNTKNLLNSGELQKIEIELRKKGINPNDPAIIRQMTDVLQGPMSEVKKGLKYLWNLKVSF